MWSQSGTEMGVSNGYVILEIKLRYDKGIVVMFRKKNLKRYEFETQEENLTVLF